MGSAARLSQQFFKQLVRMHASSRMGALQSTQSRHAEDTKGLGISKKRGVLGSWKGDPRTETEKYTYHSKRQAN